MLDDRQLLCCAEFAHATDFLPSNDTQDFPLYIEGFILIFQFPRIFCESTFVCVLPMVNVLSMDCISVFKSCGAKTSIVFFNLIRMTSYDTFVNNICSQTFFVKWACVRISAIALSFYSLYRLYSQITVICKCIL